MLAALCRRRVRQPAGRPAKPQDSAQAKAKLAAVRERISALTNRLGAELKHRDALAARLREADLGITAERRRLESLHALGGRRASGAAAELRAEQARVRRALDAERAALASQVRAAYLAGQQERSKLLLMQNDPAAAGRMSGYYGYLARDRSAAHRADRCAAAASSRSWPRRSTRISAQLQALQSETAHELAELQKARDERASALAAVTQQVASGNQELAQLKREEQAEEALVADLARVLQDFPVDSQQSFEPLRGRLPWPVPGRVTARFQDLGAKPQPACGAMACSSRRRAAPRCARPISGAWSTPTGCRGWVC